MAETLLINDYDDDADFEELKRLVLGNRKHQRKPKQRQPAFDSTPQQATPQDLLRYAADALQEQEHNAALASDNGNRFYSAEHRKRNRLWTDPKTGRKYIPTEQQYENYLRNLP